MTIETDAPTDPLPIPVTTAFEVPGRTVQSLLGPCFGVVVRSMGFTRSLVGGFKSLKRGDVVEYSGTLEEARRHALDRMVAHAQALGATAVVGMRFDSSELGDDGLAEILAYGTAVTLA